MSFQYYSSHRHVATLADCVHYVYTEWVYTNVYTQSEWKITNSQSSQKPQILAFVVNLPDCLANDVWWTTNEWCATQRARQFHVWYLDLDRETLAWRLLTPPGLGLFTEQWPLMAATSNDYIVKVIVHDKFYKWHASAAAQCTHYTKTLAAQLSR